MRLIIISLSFFLQFFCLNTSYAINTQNVFNLDKSSEDGLQLLLTANIPENSTIYAQSKDESSSSLKIKAIGKNIQSFDISYPPSKTQTHKFFDIEVSTEVYEGYIEIPIKILRQNKEQPHAGLIEISYTICNNSCIQQTESIAIDYAELHQFGFLAEIKKVLFIMLLAALGGLVLNVMPCVLPVLSLKIMEIVKSKLNNSVRRDLLLTASGIVFSFLVLGFVTIAIKFIGGTIGWGLHFQNPGFIMFLIVVLFVFAGNLYGSFEFKLPALVATLGGKRVGSFLTGCLATLLATPCTAPFLGTAVSFALTRSWFEILLIYTSMGIGMALPIITLSFMPKLVARIIPKPGKWLESFKKFLAFLLFITCIWLVFVLYAQISFRGLAVFVGSLLLLKYLFSINWSKRHILLAIVLGTTFSVGSGWFTESKVRQEEEWYDSHWQIYSEQKLKQLLRKNQTIFIEVTADWCITCKYNYFTVLNTTSMMNALKERNVHLLKADYTRGDPNIAKLLEKHKQAGVPTYIVYGPKFKKGLVLSGIISHTDIIELVEAVQ
jgi:suppressor for copper-sensitivity B